MIDKFIAVKDMPGAVREACLERGHTPDKEMTIKAALGEWTAWELGSKDWGRDAAEYCADMATRNSIL